MRPRLASLALLLLALCRPSSAGAAVAWGDAIYTADNAVTLALATRDTQLEKLIADKAKYAALAPIMGNSLHALMLKGAGKFDALPEYFKKALANGVRCEVAEADIDIKIATAQYGVNTVPIDETERTKEEALAKALTPSIDCTVRTADICFCVERRTLLYCLAKQIAGTGTKGTCRKDAVTELADKGKKALGPAIEAMTTFRTKRPSDVSTPEEILKGLTVSESMAGVHCDAIDPTVTPSIEKLYAADALYWTVDSRHIAARDVKGEANLEKVCVNPQLKDTPFNKCLCEKKRGWLGCQGAVYGKVLKDASYLDCASTPAKFDKTKKDAAVAVISQIKGRRGTPQPNPAPGPGAPTGTPPAGGNEATTAATGGAATSSSLLLAPLAAAALLL